MAESTTITIRISHELKEKLERLASVTRRSKSFLAAEAVAAYAERELAIVEGTERGIADLEAGRFVPHEEAMDELDAIVEAAKVKKASAA